jgi:hypothetical protein
MGVVVLVKVVDVPDSWLGEPPRCDDHSLFWAVEVEGGNRRVEFLDDGSADRIGMLAFDNDSTACPIDDLLHQYVAAFVSSAVSLADIFIPKVSEDILNDIFKLKSREGI